jgi:membrane protease YdiL (CAAX protease family)
MEPLLSQLARHKEFIGTGVLVVTAILFLGYFEENDRVSPALQSIIASTGVFLVIPVLYCKILLGRPLSALGFHQGNVWSGIGGGILAVGVAVVALVVLWRATPLLDGYVLPVAVEQQFLFFVLYEVVLSGFIVLLYEVFFRGLITLLWLRKWGLWSVIAQTAIFAFILYASDDINAQTIPMLLFSPFSGLIAYQSRSLWYSIGAFWSFMFITDALMLILR